MTLLILVTTFIFGLAIGSFGNAVIYRLRVGTSPFRGRSRCPHCKHELSAADLIPIISFLWLRGRCRYCGKPISWQYPLVELVMGLIALIMVVRFGLSVQSAVGTILSAFLLVIFVYDLRHQLILDRVSIPALVAALIGSLVLGRQLSSIALGLASGAGFFLVQYVLSKGRWIGGGDIRLGGVLGAGLGWPLVVVCLVLAYLSGAVVAAGLIAIKKKSWSSLIPFGTFLSAAGVVTFLWGGDLLAWYLHGGFSQWFTSTFLFWYNPAVE